MTVSPVPGPFITVLFGAETGTACLLDTRPDSGKMGIHPHQFPLLREYHFNFCLFLHFSLFFTFAGKHAPGLRGAAAFGVRNFCIFDPPANVASARTRKTKVKSRVVGK